MKNTLSGNEGRGFMKILVAADTDTVVGVHLIGPETAEIIQVSCRPSHSTPAHALCPTPCGILLGINPTKDQAAICLHAFLIATISLSSCSAAGARQTSLGSCPCLQRLAWHRAGPESV